MAALVAMCFHLYWLISTWRAFEVGTRLTAKQQRKIVFPGKCTGVGKLAHL